MQEERPPETLRLVADRAAEMEDVGALAAELTAQLYAVAAGGPPRAVRHYHEDDALLLLLRFDPAHLADSDGTGSPLSEAALMALPDMIASAVRTRSEHTHRLVPGSLTISSDRRFVSLGFSVVIEDEQEQHGESDEAWTMPRLSLAG
ncbi:MAG: hypothetical protein ABSC56_10210 [Solirubrobacteraceae bacterium]|jgi:hypothetical protein